MRKAGLDEAQAGIKIARRNINNLRYADDTTLTAESKQELKSLLMKVKDKSEKAGLKPNFQKTNFMAALTICSDFGAQDFGAQQSSILLFALFPHLFAMK